MFKYSVYCFFLSTFLVSCKPSGSQERQDRVETDPYSVEYAKGFTAKKFADYTEVSVLFSLNTEKVIQRYILVDKSKELPANLPEGIVVRTPLTRVVAYSSIHCTSMNELGVLASVIGVCEPEYIDFSLIKEGISKGTIADLGQSSAPDIEKIIDLDPEAIFISPIEGQTYGAIEKVNLPIIETPDHMEQLPLGSAEWLRFYSLFFKLESKADSLFSVTKNNYNAITQKVASVKQRPTVLTDMMYGKVWYTSGGDSFMSRMIADAGGNYIWSDNNRSTPSPLSFETVLDKAGDAHFWLIKYHQSETMTYKRLEKEYKAYSYFDAFKKRNVYECNTSKEKYYTDLPIHPDLVLQDFAYIFHPQLFPDYTPKYYRKMQE